MQEPVTEAPLKKKRLLWTRLSTALFGVLILYLVIVLTVPSVPIFFRYQQYSILTPSMHPTIRVGDLVVVDKRIDVLELEPGDIIAFYVDKTFVPAYRGDDEKVVVIHYLHEVIELPDGSYELRTIAEVSDEPDEWVLSEDDLIGVYVFHSTRLGRFMAFAQSTIGRIIIVVDVLLIILIFQLFKSPSKKTKKEEIIE